MKPVNIYALTRLSDPACLQKMERQMSGRENPMKIRSWEIESLRSLVEELGRYLPQVEQLCFYYSFQLPKLGKEFDLLRISERSIINIELKSAAVSDGKISRQLQQNRYYLQTLGRNLRLYTYVAEEKRLVRLSKSGKLVAADFGELAEELYRQNDMTAGEVPYAKDQESKQLPHAEDQESKQLPHARNQKQDRISFVRNKENEDKDILYSGDIENLFREEDYIISPIHETERFLNKEYFLTSQQKDIKNRILRKLQADPSAIQGFTGLPGTGKTLLLYDLAMELSRKDRVCILHFGDFTHSLAELDRLLKRIDFLPASSFELAEGKFSDYSCIFVDEGHYIDEETFTALITDLTSMRLPAIFSYDLEEVISPWEKEMDIGARLEEIPGYEKYRITNAIRANGQLSSFISSLMRPSSHPYQKQYPEVSLAYANDPAEADAMIRAFCRSGYVSMEEVARHSEEEYQAVVCLIGRDYYYDEEGFLRAEKVSGKECLSEWEKVRAEGSLLAPEQGIGKQTGRQIEKRRGQSQVYSLFHALSQARERIALVVCENEILFARWLDILQGK